jgi:glycosyltransferase involved in cell wall biosynthesis/SAM-dependent methyltransferase
MTGDAVGGAAFNGAVSAARLKRSQACNGDSVAAEHRAPARAPDIPLAHCVHAVTIAHLPQLPRAVVLARSLHAHHPDWPMTIVVIGDPPGGLELDPETELVLPAAAGVGGMERLAARLDADALSIAMRGPVLRRLMADEGRVVYLDPALRVLAPLEVDDALRAHEVVVTPHLSGSLPDDGKRPTEGEVWARGALHSGFLAIRRGSASTSLLENWPAQMLERDEANDNGRHSAFQGWLDGVSSRLSSVAVLPSPAFLLGYWNIAGEDVERRDGALVVRGTPARLLDLGGFDPHRPHVFHEDQDRVVLSDAPALAAVCAEHADEVLAASHDELSARGRAYDRLPDGTPLTELLRRLAREAMDEGALDAALFTDAGTNEFYAWLNAPAERGAAAGLTRYHLAIWRARPELQAAYPHLDGPDAPGYAGWLWRYGAQVEPLSQTLLPPMPDHLREGLTSTVQELPWGVNVAGFFRSELGLGEAARLMITGLDAANVPALPVQGALVPPARQGAEFTFAGPGDAPYPINLICMNGDMIPPFAQEAGSQFFEGRHSIALWWWELGEFPESWKQAFDYLDEVWVASDQIYGAIAPRSPVPVVKIPLPVVVPRIMPYARRDLGVPEDDFVFLYMYDYHSTAARKNPAGHIEAFKRAFPEPESGAALVLKCINAANLPEHHERVLLAAADRPDIRILDRYVSAQEKDALIGACDCYLSLHRSEGFGLTPAEAMYLGKPVIATRYGGTLEFMTTENSYLVDYTTTRVGERAQPYPAEAEWADPNLDQAAEYMRHVFENQDEARERGRRAAADIRSSNSPEAAASAMERRLRAIYERVSEASKTTTELAEGTDLEALRTQIDTVPVGEAHSFRARVLRKLRGVVRRLLRFQFAHQRLVDRELLDALQQTRRDMRLLEMRTVQGRASHAETLAGFRRVHRDLSETRRGVATLEAQQEASAALGREVEHHLAEHRALPYMSPERGFVVWREDGVGSVLGFTDPREATDDRYRAFTDTFRGPEVRVRTLQEPYLDLLARHGPVLDAGCGRGELLDALADAGIEALGVDTDAGMVEHCRRKGHRNVEVADVNDFLEGRADGTIGAIFSAQVIEHLPYEQLVRFLDLAVRKLRSGGLFVAETVNPHALPAFTAFWVDPTHEHPIFPEVSLELCRIAGFASGYVFHPGASGDVTVDRFREAAYAVVARTR